MSIAKDFIQSTLCRKNNQKILWIDDIKIGENAPPLRPFCRSFLSDLLEGWDYQTEEELERMIEGSNESEEPSSESNNQRIVIKEDDEQYYGKFEKDNNSKGSISNISYTKVKGDGIRNITYVSDKVGHIKPREMHEAQVLYSNSLKFMNIDKSIAPALLICDDSEFSVGAMASFNPKHNVIRIRKSALYKKKLLDIVKGQVVASDIAESTYIHELFHFKDMLEFKKIKSIVGPLNDIQVQELFEWAEKRSRKWAVREGCSREALMSISQYARIKTNMNQINEVYTEFRTLKLLEKMK